MMMTSMKKFATLVEEGVVEMLSQIRAEREKDYIVEVFDAMGITYASHNLGILLPGALELEDFANMTLSDFIESFGDEED